MAQRSSALGLRCFQLRRNWVATSPYGKDLPVLNRSFVRLASGSARSLQEATIADHNHPKKNNEKELVRQPPRNLCGIQMLSEPLWAQLFGASKSPADRLVDGNASNIPQQLTGSTRGRPRPGSSGARVRTVAGRVMEHLGQFGLLEQPTQNLAETEPFSLHMDGNDVCSHWDKIGKRVAEPYLAMAKELAGSTLPPRPRSWQMQEGWVMYHADGTWEAIDYPKEEALVFDVETCVLEGPYPTLATAVSKTAWYGWCSTSLCNPQKDNGEELIRLEGDGTAPQLIVGHSVSYDRQRIHEEYVLHATRTQFLDTMALHFCLAGLSTQQRGEWKNAKKDGFDELLLEPEWARQSSPANLLEVAKLWCGSEVDKSAREAFVKDDLDTIRRDFQELMSYCAQDVQITHDVFVATFTSFLEYCPSPITFAGMLEMGKAYLPINEGWNEYLQRAQSTFDEKNLETRENLLQIIEKTWPKVEDGSWKEDPWLRHLDWTFEPQKFTKPKYKKDGTYAKNGEPRPILSQKMPGRPKWYRDLWKKNKSTNKLQISISPRMVLAPTLYRLEWVSKLGTQDEVAYPLYYHPEHKWGYLAPKTDGHTGVKEPWKDLHGDMHFTHDYFKLPHKDGAGARCGSPISKDYMRQIKDGTLRSRYPEAKLALENVMLCSYWTSANQRIKDQFTVWENTVPRSGLLHLGSPRKGKPPSDVPLSDDGEASQRLGVILPRVITAGTVTRRAVENTWLTAANPSRGRIGSELKSLVSVTLQFLEGNPTFSHTSMPTSSKVQAPPGHKLVGADVDSQELWVAAVIGDAHFAGTHGSTAFGWMTLQGDKAHGTDMHSVTAKILGITRDQAKIVNYGRIYGASEEFASRLLQQFNQAISKSEADRKAQELYRQTKGRRINRVWTGGRESAMFNRLEQIAMLPETRTPVLGCKISSSLQTTNLANPRQFLRSRVNWVVQSSAVDYLHLLLVGVADLIDRYDIKARFCLSIHDEVRYIVADEDAHRLAFALHITNLWTRAMFAKRVGIDDLPQSVAFFSAVDVDTVLRKDPFQECITPSSSTPIPPGECLDIFQAGEACGWTLNPDGRSPTG